VPVHQDEVFFLAVDQRDGHQAGVPSLAQLGAQRDFVQAVLDRCHQLVSVPPVDRGDGRAGPLSELGLAGRAPNRGANAPVRAAARVNVYLACRACGFVPCNRQRHGIPLGYDDLARDIWNVGLFLGLGLRLGFGLGLDLGLGISLGVCLRVCLGIVIGICVCVCVCVGVVGRAVGTEKIGSPSERGSGNEDGRGRKSSFRCGCREGGRLGVKSHPANLDRGTYRNRKVEIGLVDLVADFERLDPGHDKVGRRSFIGSARLADQDRVAVEKAPPQVERDVGKQRRNWVHFGFGHIGRFGHRSTGQE